MNHVAVDSPPLAGRHALVTGGGRGIGAAIARELARLGASLTITGRDTSRLAAESRRIADERGGRVEWLACDVTSESEVERAFAGATALLGAPYILVNNAGQAASEPLLRTSRELWDRMLAVNLTGPFLCARQVLPGMIEACAGRIVTIASIAGLKGHGRIAAYSASKHGVIGLTRSLAMEVAKQGITVNAVCPAYTDTAMTQGGVDNLMNALGRSREEARAIIERGIPRGTLIRPEEVATVVGWLCCPEASGVTGQAIAVGDVG